MKNLLLVILSVISFNVYANSCGGEFQPATGTCRIIGPDGRQIIYNSAPPSLNNQSPPQKIIRYTTVNVPSKYGAIAVDEKARAIAGSINMASLSEAKKAAIKQCQKDRKNHSCKIIGWVRNGCFAVAQGKKGNRFIVSKAAEQPGQTEQVAMERCVKSGAINCQILITESCSIP